ncbi:helix-turn-helix transcriptional regulator [Acinetobacter guillouiae]|uniref:helix-turn-helix transcriptional regulator n=1 Tax=Acinetobacter guillouiae TaxID=106649 RepID=UPI00300AB125
MHIYEVHHFQHLSQCSLNKEREGKMLIKIKDVCRILKISRNTLYNLQHKDSSFPKPIKFGEKKQARIFYRENEIKKWVLNLNSTDSELEGEK